MKNRYCDENNIQLLAAAVIAHDSEVAYKRLFYLLLPKLCGYARYIVGRQEIAEEIAADALVKFWLNRKKVEAGAGIKSYFFISVKNLCFNHLRDSNKRVFVEIDQNLPNQMVLFDTAEQGLLNEELRGVIVKTIEALPEKCRMVFQLVKEEELTYQETATLLDISPKTVENQMCKALSRMRTAIQTYRNASAATMRIARMVTPLVAALCLV
jgi:RNA polymerase sigma-70 factor (ECF subfamily)